MLSVIVSYSLWSSQYGVTWDDDSTKSTNVSIIGCEDDARLGKATVAAQTFQMNNNRFLVKFSISYYVGVAIVQCFVYYCVAIIVHCVLYYCVAIVQFFLSIIVLL